MNLPKRDKTFSFCTLLGQDDKQQQVNVCFHIFDGVSEMGKLEKITVHLNRENIYIYYYF